MEKHNVNCVEENQCVGCKACEAICPVSAIKMEKSDEGFEYPAILDELCINCGKCVAFCPALQSCAQNINPVKKIYAARCLQEEVLLKSSSGGIFGVLSEHCIEQKGVVYGVAFDENYCVEYVRGETYTDINRMRGSKYVDAFMPEDLIQIFLSDVGGGRQILFSGTSCQIAGMKAVCEERKLKDDNIIWVDFFECSGKVSRLLWEGECQIYKKSGILEAVSFRDKTNGWKAFSMYQCISGKGFHTDFLLSRWSKFLGSAFSRRLPCLNCQYSGGRCGADISIGDFWNRSGLRITMPKKWKDNKGLSIVQVNTDKGAALFYDVEDCMDYMEVQHSDNSKKGNKRVIDYEGRKQFWDVFNRHGYEELCNQYANVTWKEKILLGKIRPLLIKLGLR